MYTRLERKTRLCRSIRPFAPVTSSSSPGRSPRIPTATRSRERSRKRRGTRRFVKFSRKRGDPLRCCPRHDLLGDARDFGRYNRVFGEHFRDAVLARTTVEARVVISTKIHCVQAARRVTWCATLRTEALRRT